MNLVPKFYLKKGSGNAIGTRWIPWSQIYQKTGSGISEFLLKNQCHQSQPHEIGLQFVSAIIHHTHVRTLLLLSPINKKQQQINKPILPLS